jgi:selenide,water dikinase
VFGQIAAANSISDIYAMGGKPVTCLNLVGFPADKLDPEILHGIVEGALSKITESGAVLAGGHTTDDEEPKFGLSVTGIVHPEKYWRNVGAEPGDVLILTKPIGSGVLFNANLKKWVSDQALEECIQTITTLNKQAAAIMADFDIHAVTDITGFGLGGHALEMAEGSDVTLEIRVDDVPIMREALEMYQKGMRTGVNAANRALIEDFVRFEKSLPAWHEEIFVDPQTSGGLLMSVPATQSESLLTALRNGGVTEAQVMGIVKSFVEPNHLVFV